MKPLRWQCFACATGVQFSDDPEAAWEKHWLRVHVLGVKP